MSLVSNTLVVSMYGGPGTGKSMMAASVFSLLKQLGIKSELVTEYAKDITYLKSINQLSNQIYIFGKQHNRLWRLKDQVDVIVTDAPLLNSLVYNRDSPELEALVLSEYKKYRNFDVFLKRVKPYMQYGRSQTKEEAEALDDVTRNVLHKARRKVIRVYDPFDLEIDGDIENSKEIVKHILNELHKDPKRHSI